MLHCPKCDEPVNRQCRFCPHCGLPLAADALTDETVLGEPLPVAAWDAAGTGTNRMRLYAAAAALALIAIIGVTAISLNGSRGRAKRTTVVRTRPGGRGLYGAPAGGSAGGRFTNPSMASPLQTPGIGGMPMASAPFPSPGGGIAPAAPGAVAPAPAAGGGVVPPGSILYRYIPGAGSQPMPAVVPRPAPRYPPTNRVMPTPFVGATPGDVSPPPAAPAAITVNGNIPDDAAAPVTAPAPASAAPPVDNSAPQQPAAIQPVPTTSAPAAGSVAAYPGGYPVQPGAYGGYGGYMAYGSYNPYLFRPGVNTIPWSFRTQTVVPGAIPGVLGPRGFYRFPR